MSSRVNDALSSLVGALPPAIPGEDEAVEDERHGAALALAQATLKSYGTSSEAPGSNHSSDLIKKKLLRENDSPDKAVQYGHLYSRLLTFPVLERKWAVLHLFYHLADSDQAVESSPRSESPAGQATSRAFAKEQAGRPSSKDGPSAGLNDAFHARVNQLRKNTPEGRPKPGPEIGQASRRDPKTQIQASKVKGEEAAQPASPGLPSAGEPPSEASLLRDLPFTLQGLSSKNLPFASTSVLSLPSNLPLPTLSLLSTLAEPSLLYRSLSEFVQSREEGLVSQSLRAAIGIELRSYLGLIATLEGEIRRAIVSAGDKDEKRGVTKAGVTLRRCVCWTRDATMGLRLMSMMAEQSKGKKGGQLISMIHSFSTSYGDPFIGEFAERMLSHMTRPFYDMLQHWIYDGELSDPYLEFFVVEKVPSKVDQRELDSRRAPATSVWEDKYELESRLVPSILTEDFAKKVFLIGKSLNFIRYGCGDSTWVDAYSKDASMELRYGDTATLETSIGKAYKTTMARLIHLMDNKFKLFDHLDALKKYLLLGQGDFIALLMESLAANLDRPAAYQYRHTLTAQLEHAIRGSNAQFDTPDVLRRLDARLLELSHGDIGWDVFTLEYKVDAPVDVVITQWANKQYLVVFNFLWRIKRIEFALGTTWRRFTTGARGILRSVNDKLGKDWKVARCAIAEMIHFINQLQYYILFEVIEASWDQLQAAFQKPDCTLDDLIEAHKTYLKAITHKGLLGSTRSTITGTREDSFMSQLHYILKIMLAYKEAVDGLYSYSLTEFSKKQAAAASIATRTTAGKWGISEIDDDVNTPSASMFAGQQKRKQGNNTIPDRDTDSPLPGLSFLGGNSGSTDSQMLDAIRKRLSDLSVDYRARVERLLGDLLVQPDVDLKFLAVVMNFNDVYRPSKRRRPKEAAAVGKEKKTPGAGGEASGSGNVKK